MCISYECMKLDGIIFKIKYIFFLFLDIEIIYNVLVQKLKYLNMIYLENFFENHLQ